MVDGHSRHSSDKFEIRQVILGAQSRHGINLKRIIVPEKNVFKILIDLKILKKLQSNVNVNK